MRLICTLFCLILSYGASTAQENTSKLLAQAEYNLFSDPQEAIRIAEFISNKSENKSDSFKAAYILIRSYYIEGNYAKALKVGFNLSEENFQNDEDTQLKVYVLLSRILSELELKELSKNYMIRAIKASLNTKNKTTLGWLKGKVIQFNKPSRTDENTETYIAHLDSAKTQFKKEASLKNSFQLGLIDLEIAAIYTRNLQLDSVQFYLQNVLEQSKKAKPGNYLEMKYLQEFANFLYLKKRYFEAIDSLIAAQLIAEKFANIPEQAAISEAIANNYLALDDSENFDLENKKAQLLNDAKAGLDNEAVNVAFNYITQNEEIKLKEAESVFYRNILIFGGILLLIIVIWGVSVWRYRIKREEYHRFIDYFEEKQKPKVIDPPKEKAAKQTVVPKEMEETLITKLLEFENTTGFTNQDTSLSRLALQFDTNTKYLSEVVNSHKRKNFNAYINELRINYIIDKLKNNPSYLQYKISYLAEDSGFSSHSVFATVFKQVTGISPTSFIAILKDKKEAKTPINTTDAK